MKKLLFLIMMVLLFTSTALAATSYGFSVGGVTVTSDNYTNVTGSNITSGTVVYSPSTKTVTLTNVTITRSGSNNRAIYNETNSGLIIKFVGTNKLTTTDAVPIRCNTTTTIRIESGTTTITGSNQGGIYSDDAEITIDGKGKLIVNAYSSMGIEGDGPTSGSTLTFKDCNVEVYGSRGALYKWKSVTCSNAYVLLKATNSSSEPVAYKIGTLYYLSNIEYPSGATFDSSSQAVTLNGTSVYNSPVVLSANPTFYSNGLWYKITGSNTVGVTYRNYEDAAAYSGSYTIPSSVTFNNTTYTVTSIEESAFRNCTSSFTITIPSTVQSIGKYAFYAAKGLNYPSTGSGLNIPSSVTSFGASSFQYTTGLKKIKFNSGSYNVNIDIYAFDNSGLVDVALPSNIKTIGDRAFSNCSSLNSVTIGAGCTRIGYNAFYNSNFNKITCNATTPPTVESNTFNSNHYNNATLVVPDLSTYITKDYWKNFKTINSTSTTKFLVNGIYYNITGSNTVEVTYATTNYATYYVSDSQVMQIPSTVTNNGLTYTVTAIGNSAFRNSTVSYVDLPSTVKTIGSYAFYGCNIGVVSLYNITSLGSYAFANSTMEYVEFGDNLTTIPSYAFSGCTSLRRVDFGSGLTSIAAYAFNNCPLTEIHCEKLLTPPTVASTTFSTYTATVTVKNPSTINVYKAASYWKNFTNYRSEDGYDFISNKIYYLITGTNTVEVYGEHNYYSGDIVIPATVYYSGTTYRVTSIGDNAFRSEEVANLNAGGGTFTAPGTSDVKSVTIGSNVTKIGNNAFEGCEALTQITIPSGVTSIGSGAFNGCTALKTVRSNRATPPTITSTTFTSNHYSSVTLYVPATAVTSYKAANYWKNFQLILPNDGTELNYALNATGGNLSFTSSGTYPWIVKGEGDRVYAQSGNAGVASSTSTLTTQVTAAKASTVTFDYKAWGEGTSYDKCEFLIDGVVQFTYGAIKNDWTTYEASIPAGTHTLTWTYTKDDSVNPEGDYFAVDNVKVTIKAVETGDVNGDNNVTISDVTALIDLLLSSGSVDNPACDVNGDGNVTIADVTALIDFLLGGN